MRRTDFDRVYDANILNSGFFEKDEYYVHDKERYWRSLQLFSESTDLPSPANILEIGGGQIAILRKILFGDNCVLADVSSDFFAPLNKHGIPCVELNLMDNEYVGAARQFDAVFLLEVIEHLPIPPYVIFKRLKSFLKPGGILFLTTPNLFRLRNLIRMALGREFLDRFMLPIPGRGLGHQLEYSADHLRWQLDQAGFRVISLHHDELGRVGHSPQARLARKLLSPLTLRKKWRDGIVISAAATA